MIILKEGAKLTLTLKPTIMQSFKAAPIALFLCFPLLSIEQEIHIKSMSVVLKEADEMKFQQTSQPAFLMHYAYIYLLL